MPKVSNQSLIKWPGGKRALLPALLEALPQGQIKRYYEPFLGGGALMFEMVKQKRARRYYGIDINDSLINMYRQVKAYPDDLILRLSAMAQTITEEHYLMVRTRFNEQKTSGNIEPLQHAADFLFLNHLCFNGLYRENSKGEFNVGYCHPGVKSRPHGPREVVRPDAIKEASKALHHVGLFSFSYKTGINHASAGDFIYLDPPYHPITKTANFASYSAGGFGAREHAELALYAHDAAKRGVHVMVSDHDTPEVRALYHDWHITTVKARRSISCSNASATSANEVIITSYPR